MVLIYFCIGNDPYEYESNNPSFIITNNNLPHTQLV